MPNFCPEWYTDGTDASAAFTFGWSKL